MKKQRLVMVLLVLILGAGLYSTALAAEGDFPIDFISGGSLTDEARELILDGHGFVLDEDGTVSNIDEDFSVSEDGTLTQVPGWYDGIVLHPDYWRYFSGPMRTVVVPEGVKHIQRDAFAGCYDVGNIVIPASVTEIDDYAFNICMHLETVTFLGDRPAIAPNTFSSLKEVYYNGASNSEAYYGAMKDAKIYYHKDAPDPRTNDPNKEESSKAFRVGLTIAGILLVAILALFWIIDKKMGAKAFDPGVCPRCGVVLKPGQKSCKNCGWRIF